MRIGGAIMKPYNTPEQWLAHVRDLGYRAVLAPVTSDADVDLRRAYLECARKNDLVIGEVGVWKNVLAKDEAERRAAMDFAKEQLALADELGACCCVNISGSRGERWDGFDAENYTKDTHAMIVDSVREIIDAVKPKRTFYTLETMPWMEPDSPEGNLALLHDVDRAAFGVHLDFVNMMTSPKHALFCDDFIAECFRKLGPYVKSIHGKDILMEHAYPVVIREVMPGLGRIDYRKVARLCDSLGPDIPLFVEHLDDHEAYKKAAAYVREQAALAGVRTEVVSSQSFSI